MAKTRRPNCRKKLTISRVCLYPVGVLRFASSESAWLQPEPGSSADAAGEANSESGICIP